MREPTETLFGTFRSLINLYILVGLSLILGLFQNSYIRNEGHQVIVMILTVAGLILVIFMIEKSIVNYYSNINRKNLLISIAIGIIASAAVIIFQSTLVLTSIIAGLIIFAGYFIYGFIIGRGISDLIINECYCRQGEDISKSKQTLKEKESLWLPSLILTLTIFFQTILALYLNGSFS